MSDRMDLAPEPASFRLTSDVNAADFDAERARARGRRNIIVQLLRVAVGIFIVGSWEILTRLGCYGPDSGTCAVDPFFFGQPSGIWSQLVRWVQVGTAQGPLWEQILTTLEETVLGFALGVILVIIFAVALGRHRLLSALLGPSIPAMNALPPFVLVPLTLLTLLGVFLFPVCSFGSRVAFRLPVAAVVFGQRSEHRHVSPFSSHISTLAAFHAFRPFLR